MLASVAACVSSRSVGPINVLPFEQSSNVADSGATAGLACGLWAADCGRRSLQESNSALKQSPMAAIGADRNKA